MLWRDRRNIGWKERTAYHWQLIHRPEKGLIRFVPIFNFSSKISGLFSLTNSLLFRLRISNGTQEIIDSGKIFDKTYKGGRVGVMVFSQEKVIWSNVVWECKNGKKTNHFESYFKIFQHRPKKFEG